MTVRTLAAATLVLTLALLTVETPAQAQAPPATPLCLTLPNGAPQFVTGRGSASSLNAAHNNARSDWSRQAAYNNRPGQAGYDNWTRSARTSTSPNSSRTGFTTTWTVVYIGQPCRPQ